MLKVRIYAHSGKLIVWPEDPEKGIGKKEGWIPVDQDGRRFGSVVCDTKRRLGVSREALDLMLGIVQGRDAIGDLDWHWCHDDTYAFSWFGSLYRVIDPTDCVSARGFRPYPEQCQIIDNEMPPSALAEFLVHWMKVPAYQAWWREPFAVPAYETPDDDDDDET